MAYGSCSGVANKGQARSNFSIWAFSFLRRIKGCPTRNSIGNQGSLDSRGVGGGGIESREHMWSKKNMSTIDTNKPHPTNSGTVIEFWVFSIAYMWHIGISPRSCTLFWCLVSTASFPHSSRCHAHISSPSTLPLSTMDVYG